MALRLRSSEFLGLLTPNDLRVRFPFFVRMSPRPIMGISVRADRSGSVLSESIGVIGEMVNAAHRVICNANRNLRSITHSTGRRVPEALC